MCSLLTFKKIAFRLTAILRKLYNVCTWEMRYEMPWHIEGAFHDFASATPAKMDSGWHLSNKVVHFANSCIVWNLQKQARRKWNFPRNQHCVSFCVRLWWPLSHASCRCHSFQGKQSVLSLPDGFQFSTYKQCRIETESCSWINSSICVEIPLRAYLSSCEWRTLFLPPEAETKRNLTNTPLGFLVFCGFCCRVSIAKWEEPGLAREHLIRHRWVDLRSCESPQSNLQRGTLCLSKHCF